MKHRDDEERGSVQHVWMISLKLKASANRMISMNFGTLIMKVS